MELLRKYATATSIYFPLVTAGAQDFKATPTLAAGDIQISIDGGTWGNVAVLGAETPASGKMVKQALSTGETTGKQISIRCVDQTATKEWEDQMILISTYGHASAEMPFDLSVGAIPELTADAGATPTIFQAIMRLFMEARNAKTTTNASKAIKNSAGNTIFTKAISDDTTTATEAKDTNP